MSQEKRASLGIGLVLILLGGWFLAVQLMPSLGDWVQENLAWPLIIVGIGAALLILGLVLRAPGMAIPACIVAGIGGILFWQDRTGDYATWSFAWALIPSFVGLGILLSTLLEGGDRSGYREGARLVLIGLVLFAVFGALFGAFGTLAAWWPILVIAAGLWIIVQALLRRR